MAMLSDKLLNSRKFVAYMVSEFLWKILAGLVLFWGKDTMPNQVLFVMLGIIVIAGFMEAAYLGGQALIDHYCQVAEIVVKGGQAFKMKGIDVQERSSNGTSNTEKPPAERGLR
jgi:hypothetical protein